MKRLNIIAMILQVVFLCASIILHVCCEPAAHQAARLLVFGESNKQIGYYGKKRSCQEDMYVVQMGDEYKAYKPDLCKVLRHHAGVSEEQYISCLDPDQLECLSSDSKSGQAFWRSIDGTIVVKTIKHYECVNLKKILHQYAAHVIQGTSAISAILGLYRVKLKHGKVKYFLVAKNVFGGDTFSCKRYDLKGSTVGRVKSPTSHVLKDVDLLNSAEKLSLGGTKSIVIEALRRDSQFLSSFRFMDYSLLVEVENKPKNCVRRFYSKEINRGVSTSLADRLDFSDTHDCSRK